MKEILETTIIALIVTLIVSVPVYYLWNELVPVIFNLPEITLTQSLGLVLLIGLLRQNS